MTLEKMLSSMIGDLTVVNAKQALIIENLQKQLAERNGIIADLERQIEDLKVRASEHQLPMVGGSGGGHAEVTTH